MKSLNILDVTLRDGGCLNDFNFGQSNMERILAAQEDSGVEIIELGYLDEKRGSSSGRTQFVNEKVIRECLLKKKTPGICYVAMMDYGKFDEDSLSKRSNDGIDGIRLAFHKENYRDVVKSGKKILEKGYLLFLQPMITLRYSDVELLELINLVNLELTDITAFYIVDSFGEMRPNDMSRILNLVDHNLSKTVALGYHSHNNLQMSYSNAISLMQFPTNREIYIDSSIMGMGKGAGNLNTELLMEHMNLFYGKSYSLAPLLEVIDKVINPIHSEFYWGYSPEFYLSAINHCSPSYASHFYNKHMLPIEQVAELISLIAEEKKISFDRDYAEDLYRRYNERISWDDADTVAELRYLFTNKTIMLVAPGKSIIEYYDRLKEIASNESVITIGLNTIQDYLNFIWVSRKDILKKARQEGIRVISCTNIVQSSDKMDLLLDYSKWIIDDGIVRDSCLVLALNFLSRCEVNKVLLAGVDGFSTDINKNYYNQELRNPVSAAMVESRNKYYKGFITDIKAHGLVIEFITPSRYENDEAIR